MQRNDITKEEEQAFPQGGYQTWIDVWDANSDRWDRASYLEGFTIKPNPTEGAGWAFTPAR